MNKKSIPWYMNKRVITTGFLTLIVGMHVLADEEILPSPAMSDLFKSCFDSWFD